MGGGIASRKVEECKLDGSGILEGEEIYPSKGLQIAQERKISNECGTLYTYKVEEILLGGESKGYR